MSGFVAAGGFRPRWWMHAIRWAGLAAVAAAGIAMPMPGSVPQHLAEWVPQAAAAGAAALAASESLLLAARLSQRSILDMGGGFIIRDGGVRREWSDAQVRAIGLWTEPLHRWGLLVGHRRHLQLWLDDNGVERPVSLTTNLADADGEPGGDPLRGLIARLHVRLAAAARADLAAGRELTGHGWSLSARRLRLDAPRPGRRAEIPVAELDIDDQRLWESGHAEPAAFLLGPSRNGSLLSALVAELGGSRRRPEPSASGAGDFGRLIAGQEYFPEWSLRDVWIGRGCIFLLCTVGMLVALFSTRDAPRTTGGCIAAFAASLVFGVVGAAMFVAKFASAPKFAFYERGLKASRYQVWFRLPRDIALPYWDVESFCIQEWLNGELTEFRLVLRPFPYTGLPRLTYEDSSMTPDSLAPVVGRLSVLIADRFACELAAGREVRLNSRFTLTPEGLRCHRVFLKPLTLRWEEYSHCRVVRGNLRIWARERDRPVFSASLAEQNLLAVLEFLTRRGR